MFGPVYDTSFHRAGTVEAIDLNGWLHIDQLLLARMAEILKKPADAIAWKAKAKQVYFPCVFPCVVREFYVSVF